MYLTVHINSYNGSWSSLTPEAYATLREALPQLPEEKPDYYYKDIVVDDDGLRALANAEVSVDLKPENENCMLVKLQDRIQALGLEVEDLQDAIGKGVAVQVHVPDLALMAINEVDYIDDACTDALQERLDEGWKILAVCPPNAKRRPDYILGRTNHGRGK